MSAANGTAAMPLLKLGDLTPDTRPITVERGDQTVQLTGFVDGRRCPGYVKAQVAKARAVYHAVVYDGDEYRPDDLAWDTYLREVLLAVIEGLLPLEAEVLAGDQATALDVLRALSWVRPATDDETPGPEASGEEPAATSTTAGSSPDSPPSTGSRRRSS